LLACREYGRFPGGREAYMGSLSRVELYAAIRRDSRAGGLSGRELARKYRVGRRVVALALSSAWPEPRKALPPRGSRLDPCKAEIDRILRADLDAPRKQRHTSRRIFDRLVAEHDVAGISYSMVRAYVAVRKPEVWVEAGRGRRGCSSPRRTGPGRSRDRLRGCLRRPPPASSGMSSCAKTAFGGF